MPATPLAPSSPEVDEGFLLLAPALLAEAIRRLKTQPIVPLPALSESGRRRLVEAAGGIGYRDATPVIGEGDKAVSQDFEVSLDFPRFPPDSPFTHAAAAFERLTLNALDRLEASAVDEPPRFNDLIVQRYPAGSRGISPHRDHLRYRLLVALFVLEGDGRFCVCDDRSGEGAEVVAARPGDLLLMRAPGLWGMNDRPFHFLNRIEAGRISLGVRFDTRPDATSN